MKEKKVEFNINSYIYVKLKKSGIEVYENYWKKWNIEPSRKFNIEEYAKFQAWHFMEIFGSLTHIGFNPYYDTTILIDKKDLKEKI